MALKVKDIKLDPDEQKIKRLIKKQRTYVEKLTTIKDIVRELWAEQIAGADPEYYVFSRGLKPVNLPYEKNKSVDGGEGW